MGAGPVISFMDKGTIYPWPAVTAGVTPPTVSKWSIPSGVMWVMMNPTSWSVPGMSSAPPD